MWPFDKCIEINDSFNIGIIEPDLIDIANFDGWSMTTTDCPWSQRKHAFSMCANDDHCFLRRKRGSKAKIKCALEIR
jgi:hypothetical protein